MVGVRTAWPVRNTAVGCGYCTGTVATLASDMVAKVWFEDGLRIKQHKRGNGWTLPDARACVGDKSG